jgi:pilus assembly protein CpaF
LITITIAEKSGSTSVLDFDADEVTIGRHGDNSLMLTKGHVSKHHAVISLVDGELQVEDLDSTNGTFVNGRRIHGMQRLRPTDKVYLGDYALSIEVEGQDVEAPQEVSTAPRLEIKTDPLLQRTAQLQQEIHGRLIETLDLRRLDMDRMKPSELRAHTERAIGDILEQMTADGELPKGLDQATLKKDVLNEALGLGPLEDLLADDEVSEIMVNHASQIFIERKGQIELSPKVFSSDAAVLGVIERIVAPIGRRIDESSPMVDARLKDGSRVNAIIPPLSLKGPCITIRKFRREKLQITDLIRYGSLSPQMAEFLELCVQSHRNMVISGGTGSGKTTLLNILTSFIGKKERIVTIEDAAELQIYQPHWIQLESRPANLEGKGQVTIRDLVKNCLRMRPDRIVVGECRSGETLDMLQAMNTGHDGSLTTLHANTPRDALARMETMCLMGGLDLPLKAIRDQIASAIHIIVQQTRFSDGSRRVQYITEVAGMEVDIITLQDIFVFIPPNSRSRAA